MDPNVTLEQLRALLHEYHVSGVLSLPADAGYRLMDMLQDLDHWLSNGGYLPADWNHHHGFNKDGEFG